MRFRLKFGLLLVLCVAVYSHADDLAVLRNGNSIRHKRREVLGSVTRLYLSDNSNGYIEIPTDQIERFEPDDSDAAPANSNAQPVSAKELPATKSSAPDAKSSQSNFNRESLNVLVNGAGERHQIDPDFINSVIRAESDFDNHAVSKKGAQGLMQLMPNTASQLGVSNAFDPNANVEAGTRYLRELLEKYHYDVPKALAAYNAGAKRVDQYRGVPPYFETQTYVAKIILDYNRKKLAENPSLAHKGTRTVRSSTASTKAPRKSQPKTAAASSPLRGTETASR